MSKPQKERKITVYARPPELDMILEDGPPKIDFSDIRSIEGVQPRLESAPEIICWDEVNNKSPWRHVSQLQKRRTSDALSQLKVCTTKLNLPTRRPSYLAWRKQHLDMLEKDCDETEKENGNYVGVEAEGQYLSGCEGDVPVDRKMSLDSLGSASTSEYFASDEDNLDVNKTETVLPHQPEAEKEEVQSGLKRRRQMIDEALASIRDDLMAMRNFDQALAKTLMTLRRELHQIKISRYSHAHRELLDEAMLDMERDELDEISDLPPRLFSPDLKHYGVTKMNVQTRRFSVF